MEDSDGAKSVDERLSHDLGIDVTFVEQQVRFRLDLSRMQSGEAGELGYVLIDRDHQQDVAIVYTTPAEAHIALTESQLVDSFAEKDALDLYVPDRIVIGDLAGREIVLPN